MSDPAEILFCRLTSKSLDLWRGGWPDYLARHRRTGQLIGIEVKRDKGKCKISPSQARMFKALESMGVMLVFVWHPKTPRQLIPWYDYQQKTLNEKGCLGLEIINLLPGSNSAPFHKFKLAQLREQQNLTQQELATRVGSTQSEISRAEQRDDCLVSTLERYIVGLGGKLLIDIKIDGHLYPITLCDKKGGARITVRRRGKRARVT